MGRNNRAPCNCKQRCAPKSSWGFPFSIKMHFQSFLLVVIKFWRIRKVGVPSPPKRIGHSASVCVVVFFDETKLLEVGFVEELSLGSNVFKSPSRHSEG